jgi:hypothetical protein
VTLAGIVMLVVALVTAMIVFRPQFAGAPMWRATVTPLASIIGSGFLVAGPILSHAAGNWAWAAMLALCLAGYLFGSAIRYNIVTVEPLMANGPPRAVGVLEKASEFALAFAYFVSVTYYINLFASFALRADDIIDPNLTRIVSSVVIVALGVLGATRGLGALERVEVGAVGLKLALISGLLAALAITAILAMSAHHLQLHELHHETGLQQVGVLLGLVILVQGFETSRYLGHAYDAATRVRTMRAAQLLATAIYLAFILLITPYFTDSLPAVGGETGIIDMLAPLGVVIGPLIIVTALASQLSAAVADMNGAGGLLSDASRRRISDRAGYLATAAVALIITWTGSIYEIIVYATKAFVFYYALQSVLAAIVASRHGERVRPVRAGLYAAGAVLAAIVILFGTPASASGLTLS